MAVLGAGVVGCLVARALARRKLAPMVLQAEGPRSGLAEVPTAVVWDHTEPMEFARPGLESAERFHQLEEQIGSFGYLVTGGLIPAWTDDEAEAGEAFARARADAGMPVRWLPRDEVLQREPALDPKVRGATYSPREGVLNANLLADRLTAAAVALGATFMFHAGYVAVEAGRGGFSLSTAGGRVEARKLVLTSGRWMAEIGAQLGLTVAMRTVRRRAAVTEKLPPLLRHRVSTARQQADGTLVIERVADDRSQAGCVVGDLREIAAAARIAPALGGARVARAWSWRGMVSADGRPLVGEFEDGIYVAVPHAPGVSLAPALAHAVSAAVAEGRVPEAASAWAAARVHPALNQSARKDSPTDP